MKNWSAILNQISETSNIPLTFYSVDAVSGGDINSAYHLIATSQDKQHDYFIKLNQANLLEMFDAEYAALLELQQATSLKAPKPICTGIHEHHAYIVMEYIAFSSNGDQYQLGQAIAHMHQIKQSQFGWAVNHQVRHNTIGSSPQKNTLSDDWIDFWANQRLRPQLQLLDQKNHINSSLQHKTEQLIEQLPLFFNHYSPSPSLLHGDLWGGNYAFTQNGQPIIFDPALYYGDRETDIAMTELFGGFSQRFYQGYQETYPLADSYNMRKPVYNLYHILNHANIFGGSYINQAEQNLNQLLTGI